MLCYHFNHKQNHPAVLTYPIFYHLSLSKYLLGFVRSTYYILESITRKNTNTPKTFILLSPFLICDSPASIKMEEHIKTFVFFQLFQKNKPKQTRNHDKFQVCHYFDRLTLSDVPNHRSVSSRTIGEYQVC